MMMKMMTKLEKDGQVTSPVFYTISVKPQNKDEHAADSLD